MEQAKEMAKLAVTALEEKKAEDVKVIDIRDVSTIADYFIIDIRRPDRTRCRPASHRS